MELYLKLADGSLSSILEYKENSSNTLTLTCAANDQKKVILEFYTIKKNKEKKVGTIVFSKIDASQSEIYLDIEVLNNKKIEISAGENTTKLKKIIIIKRLDSKVGKIVCKLLIFTILLALFIYLFFFKPCSHGHSYFKDLTRQFDREKVLFETDYLKDEIPIIISTEPTIEEPLIEEKIIDEPVIEEEKIEIVEKTETYVKYKLIYGDTLWDLAEQYYNNPFNYHEIAELNKIEDPDKIIATTYIIVPNKE